MTEKHQINAILEDDLSKILEHYKLLDKINQGQIKCCNCAGEINLNNIASIKIEQGKFLFQCSSDDCSEINN